MKAYRGVDGILYRETMIGVKRITIVRAEGPSELCGREQFADDWISANAILRANSSTAPKTGAYDKHDFKIVFEDDAEYSGRYDLEHWSVRQPDLASHVRAFLRWQAGYAYVTGDRVKAYKQWLAENEQTSAAAREFLRKYDVRQAPIPLTTDELSSGYELTRDYYVKPPTKEELNRR